MNFLAILMQYILPLANAAVIGIQTIHGDAVSGKDKFTMAQDALNQATAGVIPTLGGNNKLLGTLSAIIAQGAIQSAYTLAKANGSYAAATAASKAVAAPDAPGAQ